MKSEPSLPSVPGFWRTVGLLLSVARRRAAGRMNRQQELLQHRTGSRTNTIGTLSVAMAWIMMAVIHGLTAYVVHSAISEGQSAEVEQQGKLVVRSYLFGRALLELENAKTEKERDDAQAELEEAYKFEAQDRAEEVGGSEEENERFLREAVRTRPASDFIRQRETQPGILHLNNTGPLPPMLATLVLIAWFIMLICQGEGLELDLQRRRHPIWEFLFSHPVKPSAVFLAEMLSPITANPIYATGPLFFGFLYGSIYGTALGIAAATLIGVPVSVAAACVGKALEIGIMLRFPPRSRGALIGFMSWLGYAAMLSVIIAVVAMPSIVSASAAALRPLATAISWPLFSWAIGMKPDGSLSFISGMVSCWLASIVMIAGSVSFSVWGTQRGLAGTSVAPKLTPSARKVSPSPLFRRDPFYRKEILWFLRDRSAIVQAILIPVTIAGFQLFNLRALFQGVKDPWRSLAGTAVIFGTYFLWVLGPRSLASEGQALWLAQTWPRGLEGLMKAKARLWFLIATTLVMLILVFAMVRAPSESWKILLIAIGWIAFGRSMAEKSVTLVSVTSSSGEHEPIPKSRRWAASLGMLTFAIGILGQRWELAVVGIVYSWVTAAAMWENFRARLPFLFDPWSEKVPPPPTLMHAMIAISVLAEGGAVLTGLCMLLFVSIGGVQAIAVAQAVAFGITAVVVSLVVTEMLKSRGVKPKEIWCWRNQNASEKIKRWWWSGDGARDRRFLISMSFGVVCGLLLGLLANGYLTLLSQFGTFSELLRDSRQQMESIPGLRLSYAIIAIAFAPFAEEYLFRGLLFRALDRTWGGWRALLGSAAFFAIYHNPFAWLPVGLMGVAAALVFKKTGRLAPSVILHMVYNVVVT